MNQSVTCGEATMALLRRYGISTVFGIPGVHTLDFYRGLGGGITHIQSRNELGAGFMAEGWARATGRPGVALVISGPGVTNAATALGQAWADSLPLLLLSAEPATRTMGKGWGVLHEVTEQKQVTEPLTALSATALRASDVPELLAQAFTIFNSARPRPVHISIPTDVQAEPVRDRWQPIQPPPRPQPCVEQVTQAVDLLRAARCPVIMVGGGAGTAGEDLLRVAELLGAIVIASTAGKGIVPDDHPLSLSAAMGRPEARACLAGADVVLAVGTELSETDSFVDRLTLPGKLIRVDVDSLKLNDLYPATIGIAADAVNTAAALRVQLEAHNGVVWTQAQAKVAALRQSMADTLSPSERQHRKLWQILADIAPPDMIWAGDACQLVYTGAFVMPVRAPRTWFYPAGYCALGNALPNAIGAKLARPECPVAVLVGDGGFMFTVQELVTAAELRLPLPIIIWQNGGLKQIQDDMDARGIARVGVEGINPDFVALARACHCHGVAPGNTATFKDVFTGALAADRPTVIVVQENMPWLQ